MISHPKINQVEHYWLNSIPKRNESQRCVYIIVANGMLGVGESVDIKKRVTGGYVNKVKTMKYDGSLVIRQMQEIAVAQGNYLKFGVIFAQSCRSDDSRVLESQWVASLEKLGYLMLNTTPVVKRKHNQSYNHVIVDQAAVSNVAVMIDKFFDNNLVIVNVAPRVSQQKIPSFTLNRIITDVQSSRLLEF